MSKPSKSKLGVTTNKLRQSPTLDDLEWYIEILQEERERAAYQANGGFVALAGL